VLRNGSGKKLDVVGPIDSRSAAAALVESFIERIGELCAVGAGEGQFIAVVPRQRRDDVTMARRDVAEPMRLIGDAFERR